MSGVFLRGIIHARLIWMKGRYEKEKFSWSEIN